MTEQGQFDTDSAALERRIAAHNRYSSRDLNEWIFAHLELRPGMRVLELGCGTGKQTLPLAERVGPNGHVYAVDLSMASLHTLAEKAAEMGMADRITLLQCDLDEMEGHLPGDLDLALSSYSLYYANRPALAVSAVARALKPNGTLFFCGPSGANNLELREFHFGLRGDPVPPDLGAGRFMEITGPDIVRQLFSEITVSTFENPMRFDSADALYGYWSAYNLYEQSLDEAFRIAAAAYFQDHPYFETVKRVLGVKAVGSTS